MICRRRFAAHAARYHEREFEPVFFSTLARPRARGKFSVGVEQCARGAGALSARGRRVAERIETGMMFVNQPTKSQAELPFGGIKNSGYGRELSHLGILEFVNKKLIHLGPKETK